MKIGILSLHLHTNFGGIVQAYALKTVLERMGHDVEILDRPFPRYNTNSLNFLLRLLRRLVMKAFGQNVSLTRERDYNKYEKTITRNTMPFIEGHMKVNREFLNMTGGGYYDAFVVGSDQVWRKKYFCEQYYPIPFTHAFLGFAEDSHAKRIAYAPSFGTDEWEMDEVLTKECARLLKKFDAVSVREKSGFDLCKAYLGVDAIQVLDPTMLLTKEDYIRLIEEKYKICPSNNLYCYVLDKNPDLDNIINSLAKDNGLNIVNTNVRTGDSSLPLERRIQRPVEEWLKGFAEAELVITDSFHACVFSIIFQKPFIVIGNKARGMARFDSLLSMFGLESRMFDINDITGIRNAICQDIYWNKTAEKMAVLKRVSLDYLRNNLQ